jgi:hypothetical protein
MQPETIFLAWFAAIPFLFILFVVMMFRGFARIFRSRP